ncbi:MAG: hypothetical protein QM697_14830 [Lachnospiraceae bacterium]
MSLLVKNGMVYDPLSNSVSKKEIRVKTEEKASCYEEVDAENCYIIPGMIDSHAHVNRKNGGFGADADLLCIPNGVTTVIDAGSLGVNKIEEFIFEEISEYITDTKVLLNLSSRGQDLLITETFEEQSVNEQLILELYQKYSHVIKGLKVRYEKDSIRESGLLPLKRCIQLSQILESNGYRCPVTVHLGNMGEQVSLMRLLEMMRPGDVLAHMYQDKGEMIFDEKGKLKKCVREAREKGVLFDFAHGRTNFTFQNLRTAALENFWPDLLGTDIHGGNIYKLPACSFMCTMSMMNAAGMALTDIFKASTCTPAMVWGLEERKRDFDVNGGMNFSIIEKRRKDAVLQDIKEDTLVLNEVFYTKALIKNGKVIYKQL